MSAAKGVAKIFEAGLKSKTWDNPGMPHFITTTHHEGCDMCEAYALHVVEVSKVPTVEILDAYMHQKVNPNIYSFSFAFFLVPTHAFNL